LLDPRNVENVPKIEDAVGELLTRHLNELRAWREEIGLGNSYFLQHGDAAARPQLSP
jgi:hypothetical protein